jgi:hypothetical protein
VLFREPHLKLRGSRCRCCAVKSFAPPFADVEVIRASYKLVIFAWDHLQYLNHLAEKPSRGGSAAAHSTLDWTIVRPTVLNDKPARGGIKALTDKMLVEIGIHAVVR